VFLSTAVDIKEKRPTKRQVSINTFMSITARHSHPFDRNQLDRKMMHPRTVLDALHDTNLHCVVHAHDDYAHVSDDVLLHTRGVYGGGELDGILLVQCFAHADDDGAHCDNEPLDVRLFQHFHIRYLHRDSTLGLDSMVYTFDDNFSYYSISFFYRLRKKAFDFFGSLAYLVLHCYHTPIKQFCHGICQ